MVAILEFFETEEATVSQCCHITLDHQQKVPVQSSLNSTEKRSNLLIISRAVLSCQNYLDHRDHLRKPQSRVKTLSLSLSLKMSLPKSVVDKRMIRQLKLIESPSEFPVRR